MPPEKTEVTLAVIADRLDRMQNDFAAQRDQEIERFKTLKTEIDDLKKSNGEVATKIAKAEGGYMILIGLGSIVVAMLTIWDKLWSKIHG